MNIKDLHDIFSNKCKGKISTNTQDVVSESLFFAWKGENNDGNNYAAEALERGSLYVVVDNPDIVKDERYILVNDSMQTLQELAHFHRIQFDIPIVAVTGSNGKTTTKELIQATLSTEKKITATKGNLNNHVGVPLTILNINTETDIAIVEMGANHVGEIAKLCEIAHPNYGLITNIGRAHLGFFGGYEGVIRAKTELYRYLEKTGGTSFVNGSDQLLLEKSNTLEKITYLSEHSDYPTFSLKSNPYFSFGWNQQQIKTQLTGEYNLPNCSVAIAVAGYFGISEKNIVSSISKYKPDNQRSEIFQTEKGNSVIKDYYNANRSSIECALENLGSIETGKKKIVILGDIFELGEYEKEEHQAVVDIVASHSFDSVYLVGKAFSSVNSDDLNYEVFKNTDELISTLRGLKIEKSYILLKASHGMNFEKLFNEIDW